VFRGVTVKNPGSVHPYVAVANAGRADLTLLDAWDDTPVLAPIEIRALQVPVPLARPAFLAAGSLWDGPDGEDPAAPPTADLLVVAAQTAPRIELVRTWSAENAVVAGQTADLETVAPGASIVSIVAMPVPDASADGKAAGRIRVVAALTGARLAVAEYARGAGGAIELARLDLQALAVEGAPFDAVSLAFTPERPSRLYVASPDPLGAVFGVAELDVTTAPGAWTVRALDARAPTRLVAAAMVSERLAGSAGEPPLAFENVPDPTDEDANRVRLIFRERVYAALDPSRCGPTHRVSCGIAVIDPPLGRIRDDYAGQMPYLAPIRVPGTPTGITIAKPPANPPSPAQARLQDDLMLIRPEVSARDTSAVAAVPSTDGRVYYVDLARWGVPPSQNVLRGEGRTRVIGASANFVGDSPRSLGLWVEREALPVTDPLRVQKVNTPAELAAATVVTPGFTPTDTWRVEYQGVLPDLEGAAGIGHRAVTGRHTTGATWVALQVPEPGPSGETLTQVVRVYDPALGVRRGDIVSIFARQGTVADPVCPSDAVVEAVVAEILAPDPARPGGALVLDPSLEDPRLASADPNVVLQADDWPACVATLANGARNVDVQVRAGGFVLKGAATGYAGRPAIEDAPPTAPPPPMFPPNGPDRGTFRFEYENEDVLACPVDGWPADLASAPPAFFACTDDACRLSCERLALARKARRFEHVSDACRIFDPFDSACVNSWRGYTFPSETGPVLAFSLAYVPDPADPGGVLPADDPALRPTLRGLALTIGTASGVTLGFRVPLSTSAVAPANPRAASTFDRSVVPGREAEGYRFFVPFPSGFVYDFSPGESLGSGKVVR
jgi:hypothetical protein